jgi:hypothetical protein
MGAQDRADLRPHRSGRGLSFEASTTSGDSKVNARPSLLERVREACDPRASIDSAESVRRIALQAVRESMRDGLVFDDPVTPRGRSASAVRRRGESWSAAVARRVEVAVPRFDSRIRDVACRVRRSDPWREIRLELTLGVHGEDPDRRVEFLVVGRDVVDPDRSREGVVG